MDYISTDFGIDSSSRFLFFRRGQADRQTDGQTQLNDLSTTLVIHPEWDNSARPTRRRQLGDGTIRRRANSTRAIRRRDISARRL